VGVINQFFDYLLMLFDLINQYGGYTLFEIGKTPITGYRLIGVVLILILAWWVGLFVEKVIMRISTSGQNHKLNNAGAYALSRILRYCVWIGGSLIGLSSLGISMASLTFLGGAIGVGIGFGLQNIFSNLVSGIIILMEKTLKVGDFVDLQSGTVGMVKEISLRYTRVITNDNVDIIVPNAEFVNGRVTNWTYDEDLRRVHIPFGVAYGTNKDLVKEAAIAAANNIEGTIKLPGREPDIWLVNFGDSSLDFDLVVWVKRELLMAPVRTQALYLWALETELSKRNIQIPFPQRDLHIKSNAINNSALAEGSKLQSTVKSKP
jgi:small-conductance mechanosensitive channel